MAMKSIEFTGKTEDEAVEIGLAELGLTRDDVSVEIIERAKTGFLGIGSTPATVKLSFEGASSPDSAPPTESEPKSESKIESGAPEASARSDALRAYLVGLFERMGVHASVEITETETDLNAVITCEEQGVLVGKNGEVLEAIQHMSSFVVNRGRPRLRVNIDAENYRRLRDEHLVATARDAAAKVIKSRHNIKLDPMNAYERHVVHEALQDNDKISTYSIGDEPRRRVVIYFGRREER
jgi:spoIIIJ-associated protein